MTTIESMKTIAVVLERLETWAIHEKIDVHEYVRLLKELSLTAAHMKERKKVSSSPRHIIRGMLFVAHHNYEHV